MLAKSVRIDLEMQNKKYKKVYQVYIVQLKNRMTENRKLETPIGQLHLLRCLSQLKVIFFITI